LVAQDGVEFLKQHPRHTDAFDRDVEDAEAAISLAHAPVGPERTLAFLEETLRA
jgi:hypothetical protein